MLHERLVDDETEWGMTRIEYSLLDRRKEQARRRKLRSQYLLRSISVRERNERGRFIAFPVPDAPIGGKIWPLESYPGLVACTERHEREFTLPTSQKGTVTIRTRVSLPFISIQHRAALDNGREP